MRGFFLVSWLLSSHLSAALVAAKLLGATDASWSSVTVGWWGHPLFALSAALPLLGFELGEALDRRARERREREAEAPPAGEG